MTLTYMFRGAIAAASLVLAALTWLLVAHPADLFVTAEGLIS